MEHRFFAIWRGLLSEVLALYDKKSSSVSYFPLKLFAFFILVNTACYWFGMMTAFPDLTFGARWDHYFRMQFPIGVLSAAFEMGSFYLTIRLIRHAVAASSVRSYAAHLTLDITVDIAIGVVATLWVILSLSISSWLSARWEGKRPAPPIEMRWEDYDRRPRVADQDALMRRRLGKSEIRVRRDLLIYTIQGALLDPGRNWRSWYFGIVMSLSELIPTLMHLALAGVALARSRRKVSPAASHDEPSEIRSA